VNTLLHRDEFNNIKLIIKFFHELTVIKIVVVWNLMVHIVIEVPTPHKNILPLPSGL
jgi:hypothetical protein